MVRTGSSLLLCALLALGACGGKDKKDATTPKNPGGDGLASADGEGDGAGPGGDGDDGGKLRPEDFDTPGGGGGGGGNSGGGGGGNTGGGGGGANDGDGDGDGGGGGGANDGDGGGGGDDEQAGGGGGGGDKEPVKIRPPDLDLPPAEVEKRVNEHLKIGRRALAGGRGDAEVAIQEARQALQINETSVPAMVLLAHAYYVKKYYDKAEAILDIAVKRPDGARNAQLHFLFALVYERTEREEKSEAEYQKALQIQPNYKSALINLGVVYLRNKRYADAVEVYERLTGQLGEGGAATLTNLGSAHRGRSIDAQGNAAARNQALLKAETSYKKAIAADQTYANAYYNLGLLYLDADPYPEARGGAMDTLKRLNLARTQFAEYRRLPGANLELVDEQDATATKLYEKEEKKRERDRLKRERDAKKKKGNG